jgi:hypothetical protein
MRAALWAAHVPVTWDYSSTEEEPVMTVLVPMTVGQDEDGWWSASAEATTSCDTRTVAAPLSLCTGTRTYESAHCAGSCGTAG